MGSFRAARAAVAATACALVPAVLPTAVEAAVPHSTTVAPDAVGWTPQLVATRAVPKPRVDAIAADTAFATAYAGGRFDRVSQGGRTVTRSNLVAFSRTTGAIRAGFAPRLDGVVRSLEQAPGGGVYVGGDFNTVNGVSRPALVKLTASGAIDPTFRPPNRRIVYDLELVKGHLVVASNDTGNQLVSLNPTTGRKTGYVDVRLAGEACNTGKSVCSWGTTSVYDIAATHGRLAAVGNFATVNGRRQSRFFMLNLGNTGSSLSSWYYKSFATPCGTDHPRRVANLQGVDFSPKGDHVSVAATGQITELRSQVWRRGQGAQSDSTVCDAAARFSVRDDTKAEWVNYTGGDSVWRVQDTGVATYLTGHFKWVDNPDGFASRCPAGDTCARRSGIAALSSRTGRALDWSPAVPTAVGGKALVATAQGLWVGSDAQRFGDEAHRGLAFAPKRR